MIRRLVMTPARAARGGAFVPRLPPRLGVAWRALSTAAPTPGELVAVDEEDVERVALDEVMSPKLPKGTRTGIVTSTKMDKTITVQFYKRKYVPKYDVYYNKKVKVFAHDETEECREGDKVRVVPGEKRTKRKKYVLESIIKRNAV